jgi:hypothetical protein
MRHADAFTKPSLYPVSNEFLNHLNSVPMPQYKYQCSPVPLQSHSRENRDLVMLDESGDYRPEGLVLCQDL